VNLRDVEARAFDALQDADEGDGRQREGYPEKKTDPKRQTALSRRFLCVCGERRRPGARGDPVAP
jgi:hypothetical protein